MAGIAGGISAWRYASGSTADYSAYSAALRRTPRRQSVLLDLIRYASLAANSHNTQPWLFQVGNEGIRLLPDFARRTPVVDPDDHHLFVSLGCAAENLAISAEAMGYTCAGTCTDDGIMQFQLGAGVARSDPLFGAIARRQSTRALYDGRPVPNNHLDILVQSAMRPGVRVVLMTDARQIGQMRDLAVAGNNVQLGDPGFVGELKRWLRFNPRAAMAKGDGLYTACTGNPVLPDWLGPHAFDLFLNAKVENDKLARQIASSSGLAIFIGDRAGRASWVETGRACQRFLLTAAQLGLKSAFINQPVEVTPFRSELAVLAGEAGKRPDLVLRFGYGPTMPYAPRRPVSAVLI